MSNRQIKKETQVWYKDIAECRNSPYYDVRPDPKDISLLVIHNISLPAGVFGQPYIDRLFMGCIEEECPENLQSLVGVKVSSHFLIRRDGQLIQYVPLDARAWHAGESFFEDRCSCNDFSIGIELEGTDTVAYTQQQYAKLILLTQRIMRDYPLITAERIVGHCDIAPLRKTDPGDAFDWTYYLQQINYALLPK